MLSHFTWHETRTLQTGLPNEMLPNEMPMLMHECYQVNNGRVLPNETFGVSK